MKILLVEIHKSEDVWNGLGVGYLYSVLAREGHQVDLEFLHFGSDLDEFIRIVKESQYPLIGFSASFYNSFDFALTIIVRLKREAVTSHIVMGGHTPTSCYEKVMNCFPEVDSMVLGEGENTLLDLAEKFYEADSWPKIQGLVFRRGDMVIVNPPRVLIPDLDSVPYPFRKQFVHRELSTDLLALEPALNYALRKRMMVTASRGCYGRCSFCSVYHFYNYNLRRERTVENVVGEIEELVNNYGARIIAFNDDNFFDPHDREYKWCYSFADELERRGLDIIFNFQCRPNDVDYDLFLRLKEVGLHYVFVGTESFIPRTLRLFCKALKVETSMQALDILSRLDMDYQVGLIVFEPFTTFLEVKESFKIITSLYDKYNYASPLWIDRLRIYYGTKIQEMLLDNDLLGGEFPYYSYTIQDKRVETLSRIISESISDFVRGVTEKETMLAPQAGNLLFLWGISYLKNLPVIKKGELNYLPRERVKQLSIESSRLFLKLIYEAIDLLEGSPGDEEIDKMIAHFREEYSRENARIVKIITEETIST